MSGSRPDLPLRYVAAKDSNRSISGRNTESWPLRPLRSSRYSRPTHSSSSLPRKSNGLFMYRAIKRLNVSQVA